MMALLLACRPPEGLDVSIHTGPGIRDLEAVVDGPATFRWLEDGVDVGVDGRVVPADRVWPGSTWRVEVTVPDGRTGTAELTVPEPPGGNVIVFLLDDVGVDKVGAYGGDFAAHTPTLDGLAAEGVRFTRAYASSVCSPTRASLLTGRHPRRTGIGWVVDTGARVAFLPLDEQTIPEVLRGGRAEPWTNAALGKWHVAGPSYDRYQQHPNDQGFTHFAGTWGNPEYASGRGYYHWSKTVDGATGERDVYMTTDTADDVLEQLAVLEEPFFLYVAFNAPHGPLHLPPAHLVRELPPPNAPTDVVYDSMLEALDTELGRILATADPAVLARTTILTLGDNGTMENGVPEPLRNGRFKHTPYEGGVNVPFIVNGPLVQEPGSVSDALVHVVDILPTVAEIAGVPLAGPEGAQVVLEDGSWQELDGRSLVPVLAGEAVRDVVYTEAYHPNGAPSTTNLQRSVRSGSHKLVRWGEGIEELYRLEGPLEIDVTPLGKSLDREDREAFDQLTGALDLFEDTITYDGIEP
ncbi:MAG: sulfatase-like hydrolase/transferase [Alphaproteobacteria bacterium]|nr:sulfatase-like hydrolase/transferase [Alphaproteobacteria bacterium]